MIRRVVLSDIPEILDILRDMHAESPVYGEYPVDEYYVTCQLQNLIPSPGLVLLIEPGKGIFFGTYHSPWYAPVLEMHELFVYIREEHRGSMTFVKLLKTFEQEAEKLGCKSVNVGVNSGIRNERTVELYKRLGYSPNGDGLRKMLY